jgi:hypothetical protein
MNYVYRRPAGSLELTLVTAEMEKNSELQRGGCSHFFEGQYFEVLLIGC